MHKDVAFRPAVVLASKGSRKSYSPKGFDHKWRVTAYQLEEDWNWRLLMQLRYLVGCCISHFPVVYEVDRIFTDKTEWSEWQSCSEKETQCRATIYTKGRKGEWGA